VVHSSKFSLGIVFPAKINPNTHTHTHTCTDTYIQCICMGQSSLTVTVTQFWYTEESVCMTKDVQHCVCV